MGKKYLKSSLGQKIFSEIDDEEVLDLTEESLTDDSFADANSDITQEDVEDALATIAGIANAVLEVEGKEADDMEYQEVLDLVDTVTEPVEEPTEEEVLQNKKIASSVINLTLAPGGEPEELTICAGDTEDAIETVVGADVDDLDDMITPAPVDVEADDELAIAANRKVDLSQAKTFKVAINSHWKDIDAVHKKAWDMAEEKVKASGKKPEDGSRYYGMVMAIAKTYYNRLTKSEVWEDAAELGSSKIRAVVSALRKIFSSEGEEVYYKGEETEDGMNVYTHDEYVEKFGKEPDESLKLDGAYSNKKTALRAAKKLIKSEAEFEGNTNQTPDEQNPDKDGEATQIEDEGLLADGSQLSGDIDGSSKTQQPTDPLAKIEFTEKPATEEITLPAEDGSSQALVFDKVDSSISVLNSKFRDGSYAHLNGRVRPLTNSKGILFLCSNTLGLIAVKGTFQKGIKNARYSAFVASKEGFVDAVGNVFASKAKTPFLLASATSNHSTKKAKVGKNLVQAVERAYVKYLTSSASGDASYYKAVSERRAAFARKVLKQNLEQEQKLLRQSKLIESQKDQYSHYRKQVAEQQYIDEMKKRDSVQSSHKMTSEVASRNVDFLASMM